MRRKARRDYLLVVEDDGLLTYDVGPWAADKYRYVGMYAELFATGMKNHWDQRVYLDLFAGPGHSRLRDTQRLVLASPMIALSLPDPFDKYIFADGDDHALRALETRVSRVADALKVSYVHGDVNQKRDEVIAQIPRGPGERVLGFCFLDPYSVNIDFSTVEALAEDRAMDFLVLLALYVDANRNLAGYVRETSDRIARFLGDRRWRTRWKRQEMQGGAIVPFLAESYANRMTDIGYLPTSLDDMVKVRSYDRRLPLYFLAFFSRHETGRKFWKEVQKYATDQLSLGI